MKTPKPTNKGRKFPPEPLSPVEVAAIIGQCSKKAPTGVRNRALLALLYRAGLRVAEALALYPKDVDEKAGTIRILHGKGDVSRTVGLDAGAWAMLQLWIERRAKLGRKATEPLFCTLQGETIKTPYVRAWLPRIAKKAGITKRVHAHGLRHTCAAELANEKVPMNVIQQQLGHANVATTSRYVNHLAPTAVVAAMQQRVWTP